MLFELLKLFFALSIPWILGFLSLKMILKNEKYPFFLEASLAYGLGLGALSVLMFVLDMLQVPFSFSNILSACLLIYLIILIALKLKARAGSPLRSLLPNKMNKKIPGISIFQLALIIFILINLYFSFWRALNIPIASWDAFATVAFKAKMFYFEKQIPRLDLLPHKTYPLFTPLIESWICFCLGRWDNQFVKIIFPCALLSFLLISYYFLKTFTNRAYALSGIALLLSSNLFILHSTISYRDFFLLYYNCLAIIFLILWAHFDKNHDLILASLFASLATFVKLEGTAFIAIYLFLILAIYFIKKTNQPKKILKQLVIFIIPVLIIGLGFHIYKHYNGATLQTDSKAQLNLSLTNLHLLKNVISSFKEDFLYTANWHLSWFLLPVAFVLYPKRLKRKEICICLMGILSFILLYMFVAIFTENFIWIAGTSKLTGLSRLLLHFYPLNIYFLILITYPNPFEYHR
ncbi:MAG: hypothetical protein K8S27_07165 [Candidatus Omnitrophica bacterium]|nr:hypothetical protein [Candidatus Omnitrophota bacterium]